MQVQQNGQKAHEAGVYDQGQGNGVQTNDTLHSNINKQNQQQQQQQIQQLQQQTEKDGDKKKEKNKKNKKKNKKKNNHQENVTQKVVDQAKDGKEQKEQKQEKEINSNQQKQQQEQTQTTQQSQRYQEKSQQSSQEKAQNQDRINQKQEGDGDMTLEQNKRLVNGDNNDEHKEAVDNKQQSQLSTTFDNNKQLQSSTLSQIAPSKSTSTTNISSSAKKIKGQQEELQKLLKEKMKEIKTLGSKNSKLQAKYIDLFKEHKSLKKDFQAFYPVVFQALTMKVEDMQLLGLEHWENFQEKPSGTYNSEEMISSYQKRYNLMTKKIKQDRLSKNQQISSLKRQFQQTYQHQLKILSQTHQNQNEDVFNELQQLKLSNTNLTKQIDVLDAKLDAKNDELSKSTKQKLKLEHQINQLNLKLVRQQLQGDENDNEKQQAIMNERNEYLKMRQETQGLLIKRDQMKKQLNKKDRQIDELMQKLRAKNQQIEELISQISTLSVQSKSPYHLGGYDPQITSSSNINGNTSSQKQISQTIPQNEKLTQINTAQEQNKDQKYDSGQGFIKQSQQSSSPSSSNPLSKNISSQQNDKQKVLQREYLKNVIIRYLKSIINNQAESETLLRVILTILKVNEKQTKQIVQLNEKKRKTWWGLVNLNGII